MLDRDRLLLAYQRARAEIQPSELGEDALELSPGERYVFTPWPNGRAFLLDTQTLTRIDQPYRAYARAEVFQADTKLLLTSDFGLETFTLPDMQPLLTLKPHRAALQQRAQLLQDADAQGLCIDFSPVDLRGAAASDGSLLASHFEQLAWWDGATGSQLGCAPASYSRALAVSSQFVVNAGALTSTVLRLPSGEAAGELPTAEWLQFCPAEPLWAALREGDHVSVRHVLSGELVYEFQGSYRCCWWGKRLLLRVGSKLLVRGIPG